MPFRHAFRDYSASNDVHMVSIPLSESLDQWGEQEMDFTSFQQNPSTNRYPSQTNAAVVDKAIRESAASYLRPSSGHVNTNALSDPSNVYGADNYSYSQLLSMDSEVPSLNASRTSSVTSTSMYGSEPDLPPSATPRGIVQEKMCPLIAGEIDTCQPSRCGPDAPCMNFANLPPIEECTSVPCISPPAPEEISPSPKTRQPKRLSSRRSETSRSSTSTSSALLEVAPPQVESIPRRGRRNRQQAAKENTKPKTQSRTEAKQRAKAAHSLVEKKYRENLNTKLTLLHTTLQNARYGLKQEDDVDSEFDFDAEMDPDARPMKGLNSKFRKSDVLSDAMSYVDQTEVEVRHMENEIQRLNDRVRTLEKLVRCEDCSLLKGVVGLQVQPA
jgi:Helix-loop-helix DNA-binding domain